MAPIQFLTEAENPFWHQFNFTRGQTSP